MINLKTSAHLVLIGFLIYSNTLIAQKYLEEPTQHRFAKTYIGVNMEIAPKSGFLHSNNIKYEFNSKVSPRISIGGIHFWGRLDFNVNFAVPINNTQILDENQRVVFINMGDFNAKYYPWQIKFNTLRPYFGFGLNYLYLNVINNTFNRSENYLPIGLIGGLSYNTKNWQLFAEVKYITQNRHASSDYLYQAQELNLPNSYLYLGISRFFDATIKEEKPKKAGKIQLLEKEFPKVSKLNSLSIGLGANTSYFLKQPKYDDKERLTLPALKMSNNLDLSIGYWLHKSNIHLGVAYRAYSINSESFNYEHVLRRNSIALEVHKQLFNWNGFAPYVGPSISYERWATAEFIDDVVGSIYRTRKISPGIIFGWDILSSNYETWVLRTNLRYYPLLKITNALGEQSRVDQFEMNFIQIVVYPQRMIRISKAKKKIRFYE